MSEEQVQAEVVEQVAATEDQTNEDTESTEVETDSEGTDEEQAKAEKKANKKSGFEKRIQRLNNKVDLAAADAAHWRAIAQQNQQSQQTQTYQAAQDPVEALVEQKLAARDQAANQAKTMQTYNDRVTEFKKTNTDFAQILKETDDLPCATEVHQICLESEVGPAIAYHLAKNIDELERINALPAHRRLIELGKLEDKLISKQTKTPKETKAVPKPVNPTIGKAATSVGEKSIYEMSPQELMAHRNKTNRNGRR